MCAYVRHRPVGSKPFALLSRRKGAGNRDLRNFLGLLGIEDAHKYCSHDLRRGHTKDLRAAGASWQEILEQGGWASQAVPRQSYLQDDEVEVHSLH